MVSTFGGLNTAYSGLNAARQGLDVVGQNISNATTAGYTRQRITTTAVGTLAQVGPLSGGSPLVGQGVSVDGIARLGDSFLDARVRITAAAGGNLAVRSNAFTDIQASLGEPSKTGIAAQLTSFWSGWSAVALQPGTAAPAGVLLQNATVLSNQIATGYTALNDQWTQTRGKLSGMVDELNQAATSVAALNGEIRSTLARGGSANELIDQRNQLTTSLAALTGGTVRELPDGTAEVLVGGNTLVSGDKAYGMSLSGSTTMVGATATPLTLQWTDRPTVPVAVESGEIAGALSVLAGANATGTGGAIAEAAEGYNKFATYLATTVNAVHSTGTTPGGATGLNFFGVAATGPAALGLSVIPTSAAGIATGVAGAGGNSGANADAIAQLGMAANSPDSLWSTFVTGVGVAAKSALQQATLADSAARNASTAQLSNASVDLDEENVNMLMFQTSYQGAARVMTTIDEMLDTLINRTGIVGR